MKIIRSFAYAFTGIAIVIKSEINAIIHLFATAVVVGLGLRYEITSLEWISLLIVIGMVWLTEIINTALEETIDLLHPERAVAAGRIKDMAAGAVLVAALIALAVGCIIFIPYLLE